MIKIRSVFVEEHPFIMSSWLKSYRASSEFAKDIPSPVYFKWHHALLEALLSRPTTTVQVATPEDDDEVIVGYIVYERTKTENLVHYIYVKRPFGHMGVCRELLDTVPFDLGPKVLATHQTYKGAKLIRRLRLTYCPYAI